MMVVINIIACLSFWFFLGTFKTTALPISFAVLFVLFYFAVQREEKAKKAAADDSL